MNTVLQAWKVRQRLFSMVRAHTMLYALVLTLVGFRFVEEKNWPLAILCAGCFALITTSIMVFNDYIDREHDIKKDKVFASQYAAQVLFYWRALASATLLCTAALWFCEPKLGAFCFAICVLGHLYSFVPHWYVIQNIVVALCSASPVLCGPIADVSFNQKSFFLFVVIFLLIWAREIMKDIDDRFADPGYKNTVPVKHSELRDVLQEILRPYPSFLRGSFGEGELGHSKLVPSLRSIERLITYTWYLSLFWGSFLFGWAVIIPVFMVALSTRILGFGFLMKEEDKQLVWLNRSVSIGISIMLILLLIKG